MAEKDLVYSGEDDLREQVSSLCRGIESKAKLIIHLSMPQKILSLNTFFEVSI